MPSRTINIAISLLPPLAITEDLLERGSSILEEVLKGVSAHNPFRGLDPG
ncbi:MAG: hypothetical protein QXG32_06890 [Candidatus Bathyarchaeia archaeon]